ncbi:hypothetical protein T11_17606, partial [Trichinella zimbabwensis]
MKEKKRSQLLRGKRHWSGEEGAEYVVEKQQKAGERGRRFFGGKFLCPGQKPAELFKRKQLWDGQKMCPALGWKMAPQENESIKEKKRSQLLRGKRHWSGEEAA